MAKTSGGIRGSKKNDDWDLDFASLHQGRYTGVPAKPKTEDEKYWGYINGRMAYYRKHGHL